MSQEPKKQDEHVCKWVECTVSKHPSMAALVTHVSQEHLTPIVPATPNVPVRYSLPVGGMPAISGGTAAALCPHFALPYAYRRKAKHFTRLDALAKHVKGVHDLHQHRDAIALMRYRSDKGKDSPIEVKNLTEDLYTQVLHRDYALRVPWWFSQNFVDVLLAEDETLEALLAQPYETRHHGLAALRYKKFLSLAEDDELISSYDIANNQDLVPFQNETKDVLAWHQPAPRLPIGKSPETYEALKATLATATRVNKIVKSQLLKAVAEKRRLWTVNQALLDANIKIGLGKNSGIKQDSVDEELLADGVE
ncbi:hypothetical protein HF325_002957 [Metschnikowia pulcherrima]|uniref:Uncharacterized protein n=1 Tax=Metschnikowia pulcherrima TaxID=27326 RepID=A0A8H7LEF4_9ASCO|nr:hypothetical protein HF325_002957 [Metschnikowia pulcherrima]